MKIVYPETSLIMDINPFLKIEKVGRTCYKSDSEFNSETAIKFFNMLKDRKHYGIFEHTRFIFEIDNRDKAFYDLCRTRPYFMCTQDAVAGEIRYLVSANLRAINEGRTSDYVYGAFPCFVDALSERFSPELDFSENYDMLISPQYAVKVYKDISQVPLATLNEQKCHSEITAHFILDRGISHEFVRHREFSFAQESTRYCNYGLNKFNKEITVINQFPEQTETWNFYHWKCLCEQTEFTYLTLLDDGVTPQTARGVLPTCLKTELVMTGTLIMWQHFFDLRYYEKTGKAHPLAKISAEQMYKLLDEKYAIKSNFDI